MSDQGKNPAAGAKGPSKLPLILALVNSVALLGAAGFLTYTKLLFKRPAITEEGERAKLAAVKASPRPAEVSGTIQFDPITVNIAALPAQAKPAEGTPRQIQGKLHYVQVGFVLEIRDISRKDEVEAIRPMINDKLLSLLGRKEFQDLTTVQGRYILRTQILDLVNQMLASKKVGEDAETSQNLVSQVFFTQFIVQ